MEERIHTINNLYSDMNEITEHLMTIIQAAEEAQALIKERANANSEVKRHVVLNGRLQVMWERSTILLSTIRTQRRDIAQTFLSRIILAKY